MRRRKDKARDARTPRPPRPKFPDQAAGMAAQLRRRFFRVAAVSFTITIVMITAVVNVVNVAHTLASLDVMCATIMNNRGYVPDFTDEAEDPALVGRGFSKETPFATRYFTVTYGESDTIIEANLAHIASVDASNLGSYIERVNHVNQGSGTVGQFRYLVERQGTARVAVFLDASKEFSQMQNFAVISGVVDVAAIVVVCLLVWWASPLAIEPVVEANLRQRRFITDASHELKTPLTVMRTSLALAEATTGPNKWLDKCDAQAAKLTDLIDDLIVLSRLEEGRVLEPVRFDLAAATLEVAATFDELSERSGRPLVVLAPERLECRGDEMGMRRLESILLENAFKHASGEGPVELAISEHGHTTCLSCANPAEGLDPEATRHMFDRFWRADESRNGRGFGIGLSIAKSICDAHGATIKATLDERETLTITATFPHTAER